MVQSDTCTKMTTYNLVERSILADGGEELLVRHVCHLGGSLSHVAIAESRLAGLMTKYYYPKGER